MTLVSGVIAGSIHVSGIGTSISHRLPPSIQPGKQGRSLIYSSIGQSDASSWGSEGKVERVFLRGGGAGGWGGRVGGRQAIERPSPEITLHISKPRAGLGLYPPAHTWSVAREQCLSCRVSCGPSFVNKFPILFRWHIFLGRRWTKPCSYYPCCTKQGKMAFRKPIGRDILPVPYMSPTSGSTILL